MRHIDLFSGIGGFALAAREVWGDEYENVLFCDNNNFCKQVLRKNFGKDIIIYDDIRQLTADAHRDRLQVKGAEQQTSGDRQFSETSTNTEGRQSGQSQTGNRREDIGRSYIDLLTGGFPCQPFSQAGKRKGTDDDRYLWPEMLRVIHDFKPTYVVAENVRGILTIEQGMVFEQVCLDMEREGYEVQTFIIPAVAVNAPHRRDRIWIIGNAKSNGRKERYSAPGGEERQSEEGRMLQPAGASGISNAPDTTNARLEGVRGREDTTDDAPDTGNEGLQRGERSRTLQAGCESAHGATTERSGNPSWLKNWLEVATELCGVDDGLPARVDDFTLTKAGHRVERLKALGNAIVPQVAIQLFRGLKLAMLMETL